MVWYKHHSTPKIPIYYAIDTPSTLFLIFFFIFSHLPIFYAKLDKMFDIDSA